MTKEIIEKEQEQQSIRGKQQSIRGKQQSIKREYSNKGSCQHLTVREVIIASPLLRISIYSSYLYIFILMTCAQENGQEDVSKERKSINGSRKVAHVSLLET